jgi:hypothetical protein
MKQQYLENLRKILLGFEMNKNERIDILNDYASMYEDGLSQGLSDSEVIEKLGTPEKVAEALNEEYHRYHPSTKGNRLIAVMPFLAVISYFILGFYFDKWHPGWLVFLAIPMTAIIVEAFKKPFPHFLTALSPFIATVAYLGIGFGFKIWHPTWLIFLIIPIFGIINSFRAYDEIGEKKSVFEQLTGLSVFIAIIAYVLMGYYLNAWNPGWLVFLIIPILGILNEKVLWKKIGMELSFLIAIGVYLFVGYQFGNWWFGALGFLLPIGFGLLTQEVRVSMSHGDLMVKLTVLSAIAIYFITGILWNTWAFMWMIFLLIPMVAILKHGPKRHHIVAISPFIATIVFFSLGYFFGLWEISWMAFLFIPISAIMFKG